MRVLYVSTEVHPALKTGGLADVNAALPPALAAAGADVRMLLPGFPALLEAATAQGARIDIGAAFGIETIGLVPCRIGATPVWLIDAPTFFARSGNPYVDGDGRDWPDNAARFALLGWIAARFADGGFDAWRPDIVHSHDWHAGLACAYLRARGGAGPGSVFTIHNLGYQGQFDATAFAALGLPDHFFSMHGLEFHGKLNFMKAALFYADRITTVSPTYAREIQGAEHGFGMEGLLRSRAGALSGILNGIATDEWNPQTDRHLGARYSADQLRGKAACGDALRAELGLTSDKRGPLLGVVSRLTPQKGLDLLLEALPVLLAGGGQCALLGSGDAALEAAWLRAAAAHPGNVAVKLGYDEALAHRIFAGSDMIAVPSRFEPCGLTQMYGLRYGTLPLVRRTGGLADTVIDAASEHANGFVFDAALGADLGAALQRALALWQQAKLWQAMQRRAMQADFGWAASAGRYITLYRELRPHA